MIRLSFVRSLTGAGGNVGPIPAGTTVAEAQAACCANLHCAGFSFPKTGTKAHGFYKGNAMGKVPQDAGTSTCSDFSVTLSPPLKNICKLADM